MNTQKRSPNIMSQKRSNVFRLVCFFFALGLSLVIETVTAFGTTITVINDGVVYGPNPGDEYNEPANLVVGNNGGFIQRSSRVATIDTGDPSDLVLTNFRIALITDGDFFTKNIKGEGYMEPIIAGSAWHIIDGDATLLGPMGCWAQITLIGWLDEQLTGFLTATATKNGPGLVYSLEASSPIWNMDPPTYAPHTREVTYIFSFGGGALPGSEIRLTSSGENPFDPVPEPSTILLFGLGLLGIVGIKKRVWEG